MKISMPFRPGEIDRCLEHCLKLRHTVSIKKRDAWDGKTYTGLYLYHTSYWGAYRAVYLSINGRTSIFEYECIESIEVIEEGPIAG